MRRKLHSPFRSNPAFSRGGIGGLLVAGCLLLAPGLRAGVTLTNAAIHGNPPDDVLGDYMMGGLFCWVTYDMDFDPLPEGEYYGAGMMGSHEWKLDGGDWEPEADWGYDEAGNGWSGYYPELTKGDHEIWCRITWGYQICWDDEDGTPHSEDHGPFTTVVGPYQVRVVADTAGATGGNIACGGKNTPVHQYVFTIKLDPPESGLRVEFAIDSGGEGHSIPGSLSAATVYTNASGEASSTYTSSDRLGDVVLSAKTYNHQDNPILRRTVTLHEVWDQDDPSNPKEWDFTAPATFIPEIPDTVKYYPTLKDSGGDGAIDGNHAMEYETTELSFYYYSYNLLTDNVEYDGWVRSLGPDFQEMTDLGVPKTAADLVEYSPVTMTAPGVYENQHTVHDFYDFDGDCYFEIQVDYYGFTIYDRDVWKIKMEEMP